MDAIFNLLEPEDLDKDSQTLNSLHNLKEEIKKLQEKYGDSSAAALKEVESLIDKFEVVTFGGARQESKYRPKIVDKYKDLDEAIVRKAQHIVRSFLKRRRLANLASQFLNSNLAKELGKRNDIWKEILNSEKQYFQSLVLLFEVYCKPLKMRLQLPTEQKIVTEKQIHKMFQNIDDVKNVAKTMWKKLEAAAKSWPESAPRIGQIVVSTLPEIKQHYVPYIKGIPSALKTVAKLRKKSEAFDKFIEDQTVQYSMASNEPPLPISTLLMLPLLRLLQYETFLKELLILTPQEHVDFADLTKALREIIQLNQELTTVKFEAQKAQKIYTVLSTVKGNIPTHQRNAILTLLLKENRAFVREGPIWCTTEKKTKKMYMYLFNDIIVFADINEATEEKYYESTFILLGAEIKEIKDDQNLRFGFLLSNSNKKLVLSANTAEERKSWINDISALIKEANQRKPDAKRSDKDGDKGAPPSARRPPDSDGSASGGGNERFVTPRTLSPGPLASTLSTTTTSPRAPSSPHQQNLQNLHLLQSKHQHSLKNLYSLLASPRTPIRGPTVSTAVFPSPSASIVSSGSNLDELIESASFRVALHKQHSGKTLNDFLAVFPEKIKVKPLTAKNELYYAEGPVKTEGDETERFIDFFAARSTSTYPFNRQVNVRVGDPIASKYAFSAFKNRMMVAFARGLGQTSLALMQTALTATTNFIHEMKETQSIISEIRESGRELLRLCSRVHETIILNKEDVWNAGTVVFLGGVLFQVEPHPSLRHAQWCFTCVNIGDCKAYLWSRQTGKIREITDTIGRKIPPIYDLADPGGRLGPYIYQGAPDLRNLGLYHIGCNEGDLIILCSSAVHENFDPEVNGYTPNDLQSFVARLNQYNKDIASNATGNTASTDVSTSSAVSSGSSNSAALLPHDKILSTLKPESLPDEWHKLDPSQANALRNIYRAKLLERLIGELEYPINPARVTKRIIEFCFRNTSNSREFCELNPTKKLPPDRKLYPGVLGHPTCITIQVGPIFVAERGPTSL
jgi:hypothetical protein